MECELCKKVFKNTKGLSQHLKCHSMTLNDYLNKNREIPKCQFCENSCKPRKGSFTKTCTGKACVNLGREKRVHSLETISKIRQKRVEYLKQKTGKTAWERRSRKEMSYLENWFQEEVVIKHSLQLHHQIITEHCVQGYFIDFAFLDKMIAVEIDGRCHFDKNMNRQKRDYKKDECLIAEGWNVIRMNFFDIKKIPNDLIENFLKVIEDGNKESLDWIGQIRYREFKKQKIHKLKTIDTIKKLEKKQRMNQAKADGLLSANIDFRSYGWVQIASKIIGISPQKTRAWLRKNLPNILENSFARN